MNKTRFKIALLVGGTAVLTLLIVMAVYQLVSRTQIRSAALTSFRLMHLPEENETDEPDAADIPEDFPYPVNIMEYDYDLLYGPNDAYSGDAKLRAISRWCRENDPREPTFVRIGDWDLCVLAFTVPSGSIAEEEEWSVTIEFPAGDVTYTVAEMEEDPALMDYVAYYTELYPYYVVEYHRPVGEPAGETAQIGYIDVTNEYAQIRELSLYFLLAALLVGCVGSAIGYWLGKRIEQYQEAEKRFYENASHELKTPLAAIRGYAEGVQKGLITDYRKTGRVIASQAERMSRLIEEILCRTRLESGAIPLQREPVELDAFVQDCIMPFEGAVASRGLQVGLTLEKKEVSADPALLEHALTNLITNAMRHAVSELKIELRGDTLSVWNDADAPDADGLEHAFDRFYTGSGGSGIGLSLAKEIIELHGWHITAARDAGGVRFTIMIIA